MWRPPSESEPWEADESPVVPEPVGPFDRVEPSGRALTERAEQQAATRAAVEKLAQAIEQSKQAYRNRMVFIGWPR